MFLLKITAVLFFLKTISHISKVYVVSGVKPKAPFMLGKYILPTELHSQAEYKCSTKYN